MFQELDLKIAAASGPKVDLPKTGATCTTCAHSCIPQTCR